MLYHIVLHCIIFHRIMSSGIVLHCVGGQRAATRGTGTRAAKRPTARSGSTARRSAAQRGAARRSSAPRCATRRGTAPRSAGAQRGHSYAAMRRGKVLGGAAPRDARRCPVVRSGRARQMGSESACSKSRRNVTKRRFRKPTCSERPGPGVWIQGIWAGRRDAVQEAR